MTEQIACFYSCASRVGTSRNSSVEAEIRPCPKEIEFGSEVQNCFLNFRKWLCRRGSGCERSLQSVQPCSDFIDQGLLCGVLGSAVGGPFDKLCHLGSAIARELGVGQTRLDDRDECRRSA